MPSLRDRFRGSYPNFPGLHAFGYTPRHSVSAMTQRSFSDLATPPVRYVPRGSHRMQPSYCFRGATATHRFSNLLRPLRYRSNPCRAFRHGSEVGVRVRLWSFVASLSGRLTRTSIRHPIYLRAGICLSCLILARYSCRSRSPVSSKARDATPDFTFAPLYDPRLSPRGLVTSATSL